MRHRLGVLAVIGLLAACGGGDDDAEPAGGDTEQSTDGSAEPSGEPTDDATSGDGAADDSGNGDGADDTVAADDGGGADDTVDADDGGGADDGGDGGNSVTVSDLSDIPQECRQILGDFMREIEPVVEEIDWDNATLQDLDDLGTSIDAPSNDVDAAMTEAGCGDIDFAGDDERGFDLVIELARQEAPGVVGWLEFIRDASAAFDAVGTSDEPAADAPEDCDAAIEAVRELMSETESMAQLPVDELLAASSIVSSVTSLCSIEEMSALFDDPQFAEWTDS